MGLFGTVMGIVDAFHGLGTAGAATLRAVAPGICEALITTAAGLFVAVPAVVAYNQFTARIRVFASAIDDFCRELLNSLEEIPVRAAGAAARGRRASLDPKLPGRLNVAFTSSNGQTRTSLAEINITPLVDVVLVLLVIFMITAPVLQSGIEVAVPKTRTVKEITEQRHGGDHRPRSAGFSGRPAGEYSRSGAEAAPGRAPIRRNQVIYLRADERVPFGAFASVMDAVKQAGITNISIVTQPLDTKGIARRNGN